MTENLLILAGKMAYDHIRENGLDQSDISAVIGASGAAKWLVLHGLDCALYSRWFKDRKAPLHLFGTSIGAWKFAAAAQVNPEQAFKRLKDAYINQTYPVKHTPKKISVKARWITELLLPEAAIGEVLSHPYLRIGFSAVRCKGIMASSTGLLQAAAMWSAFELNVLSRKLQGLYFERTLFHHPEYDTEIMAMNHFKLNRVALDRENFTNALLASASMPILMEGVKKIPGAPKGVYRDGGLLDYHPVFPLNSDTGGFILYPHFYPEIIQGWFDKKLPWRRVDSRMADRVVLLVPTPELVASLPHGRIPDRHDFIRFKNRDEERIQVWNRAAEICHSLGEEFLEAVSNGRIKKRVRLIQ